MRKQIISLLLLSPLLFTSSVHAGSNWNGNINLLLGAKSLDEQDWLADQQGEVGLLVDFGHNNWPFNIAIDMLSSRGDFDGLVYLPGPVLSYVEEEVTTRELNLGVRHYFQVTPNMRPYFGGGIAFVSLKTDWRIDGGAWQHDQGKGEGIWLNGGISWAFDAFNLGFDIRATMAQVDMDLGDYEGGGGHAGLLLGYHW